jgi:prolyl-tRNA synthetase
MTTLEAQGFSVILDDRDERPGFKFKDADLLGFPLRVVVSERSLAAGQVEIKRRGVDEKVMVSCAEASQKIVELLK